MDNHCDREFEVLECAAGGRAGDELSAHLASCSACRDLFEVARAVSEDRSALMRDAQIPGAGLVWWRNNLRAEREAARTALRTGRVVEIALVLVAIAVSLGILSVSVDLRALLQTIADSRRIFAVPLLALIAWLVFAPAALYFAIAPGKR